jgi:hypothetical protein
MVRGLIRKRFDRFEQTGDATGITVIKTGSGTDPEKADGSGAGLVSGEVS